MMTYYGRRLTLVLLAAALGAIACESDPVALHRAHEPEVEGFLLRTPDSMAVLRYSDDAGAEPDTLVLQQQLAVQVRFLDHDGEEIQPPLAGDEEEQYGLDVRLADEAVASWTPAEGDPWAGTLTAHSAGETSLRVSLLHGDHPDWQSATIPVTVP